MDITVKIKHIYTEACVNIKATPNYTVQRLKEAYKEKTGLNTENMKFSYISSRGTLHKNMDNIRTLKSYNVRDGDTITFKYF